MVGAPLRVRVIDMVYSDGGNTYMGKCVGGLATYSIGFGMEYDYS